MKESGIDWIGQIPQEWEISKIRYLVTTRSEKRITDSSVPYIGLENIESQTGKFVETGIQVDKSENIVVEIGDILFGKLRPYLRKYWRATFTSTASSEFLVFQSSELDMNFLYYAIQSDSFIEEVNTSTYGSKMPRASWEYIKNMKIAFPTSLVEQQKIADFLDKKTAQLDKVKSLLEEQIQKLNAYRASLIYETVTKGLDKTVPMKDSGIDWIGQVPEGWGVSKLKFILEKGSNSIKVGPFGSSLSGDAIRSSGKWVYNQRNVLDNNFTETDFYISEAKCKELKNFSVSSGDILLTTRGTIGRVAIVPKKYCEGIIHPCLMKFKVDSRIVLPELIKYLFNDIPLVREQLNFLSNSTTIDVIYSYNLKNIIIPTIPIEEQYSILEVLDRQTSDVDALIKIKQKQIENINKQRQTLIYDYVTGKRRV